MIENKPPQWREGQTLFNFQSWLLENNHAPANQNHRLADIFHLSDKELNELYKEFLKEHDK